MKRVVSTTAIDSANQESNRDIFVINKQSRRSDKHAIESKPKIHGVARVVSHAPALNDNYDSTSSLSSSVSTSLLAQELLSQSERKHNTGIQFDEHNLKSLKQTIQKQKTSRAKEIPTFQNPVRPETLIRKVASTAAPNSYLGFTTGNSAVKKPKLTSKPSKEPSVIKNALNTTPVRKIASRTKNENKITTSSWKTSARNAKRIIEEEKTKTTETSKLKAETLTNETPEPSGSIEQDNAEQPPSKLENFIENNISPEVFGILKELQLDLVPESKPEMLNVKPTEKPSKKRTKKNNIIPNTANPNLEKRRHYKSDDVKLFMLKQKEKRRLDELKKKEEAKLRAQKMEKELAKIKDRQIKMSKRNPRPKISQEKNIKSGSSKSSKEDFDPYAKALAIIGDLEGKVAGESIANKIPPTPVDYGMENGSEEKSSSSNAISIPEFKSLPNKSIKPDMSPELSNALENLNKSSSSHFSALSSNMKVENYLDKSCEKSKCISINSSKANSRKPEHVKLLNSLKTQSDDITKRTLMMTNKLNEIESEKIKEPPPGAQLVHYDHIPISTFKNNETDLISKEQLGKISPVPDENRELYEPSQNVYAEVTCNPPIVNKVIEKQEQPPVFKNVSFVRAKSPDELNLVNLMYQKEKERRKREKREKREKRKKKEAKKSKKKSKSMQSASLISISKSQTSESAQQILSKNSRTGNYESSSMTTISDSIQGEYSTPFESFSNKSKLTSTKIDTSSFSEHESSQIKEESQILTNSSTSRTQTAVSQSGTATKTSSNTIESSIHDRPITEIDSISESYSIVTSQPTQSMIATTTITRSNEPTSIQDTTLERILEQNKNNELVESNMILVDQVEQKTFLNEMRQIQETGKKAAELMLKASRNMAKQADITVTSSSELTKTVTKPVEFGSTNEYSTVLESGPLPPSSDEENDFDDRNIASYEPSSSGTITSKISPRTETGVQTEVDTETQVATSMNTVSKSNLPSESTNKYIGKSQSAYSDKFISDESDFDKSLTLLTPSVEHRERVRRQRIPSEQSSSDMDIALDDSFTTFMKDMVDQFMTKKANRTKFVHHMSSAKDKAAKEKKKREKEMKRYYKTKRNFDEKMVSVKSNTNGNTNSGFDITTGNSGSDTSFASTSTVDRVKKYLSTVNESYLTKREQDLQKRRKRAEKLLKWKRRLDEQEKSIIRIEEKAGNIANVTSRNIESELSTERDIPDERSLQESITTEDTTNHTTLSETDLDQSDADIQIRAMRDKLRQRQHQAARLRKQLKKTSCNREKLELTGKEEVLRSQIEKFDRLIAEGKEELANLSAEEWPEGGVKPRIRSPSKDSSISSNSSVNQLRISSSKIKSLTSDDSVVSPRRSPLPKVPQDIQKNSSISSETSTIDEEYSKTFSRANTDGPSHTDVYTDIVTHKAEQPQSASGSENETETNNRTISPVDLKSTIESIASETTETNTVTTDKSDNVRKDTRSLTENSTAIINKSNKIEPDSMVNQIMDNMIDEFIGDLQDKQAFKEKLKGVQIAPNNPEEGGIDVENILPGGSSELEDDSLIKALLDHVERQEENENRSNNQIKPNIPTAPQFRSFSEISTTARSFASTLFFSEDPLVEKIPFGTTESNTDWIEALWAFCCELTDACLLKSKLQVKKPQNKKPWEKTRFSPIPKFAKVNPKTPEELNTVIQSELKNLLSPSGPSLDERVLQKMGSKSRKDRVDLLLIGELREEEKLWTEYDEDEDQVMSILTDSIFDLLISDTLQAARDVEIQRSLFCTNISPS